MIRMFIHILANGTGHGEPQVRININFANSHFCSLTQHIFGNANGVGHGTAVIIDHFHILGNHRRSAVKHNGESRQTLSDFFQNIKTQLRFLAGFELISAMAGANGDCQGINPCTRHKFLHFLGTGIRSVGIGDIDVILNPRQASQFSFDNNAVIMGIIDNLFG